MQIKIMHNDKNRFDFFSSRLDLNKVTTDHLTNMDLWLYLKVFENYAYGVFLQYNRIKEDLNFSDLENFLRVPHPQAGLDIYYFILTWDKVKKISKKINKLINRLAKPPATIPMIFTSEYRKWRKRAEHLFSEFDTAIRNEYEHPSLELFSVGNAKIWGNILIDRSGNIEVHAGNDLFFIIKNEHCLRIQQLRTDLFDLFIEHFSQKPLTQALIETRQYIEDNIDLLSKELRDLKEKNKREDFNELSEKLMMYDIYFSRENMPLSEKVKNIIYSFLYPNY